MKVRIDETRCQGHTMCALAASGVFEIRDEDAVASVRSETVPVELEQAARYGADSCPERAIELSD